MKLSRVLNFIPFITLCFAMDIPTVDKEKATKEEYISSKKCEDIENMIKELLDMFETFAIKISQINESDTASINQYRTEGRDKIDTFMKKVSQMSIDNLQCLSDFIKNIFDYSMMNEIPTYINDSYPNLSSLIYELRDIYTDEGNPSLSENKKVNAKVFLFDKFLKNITGLMEELSPEINLDNIHLHLTKHLIPPDTIIYLEKDEIAEFKQNLKTLQDVAPEFNSLKLKDFIQTELGAACYVYSLLWGIHQNEVLKSMLSRKIGKDQSGNYYFDFVDRHNVTHIIQVPGNYVSTLNNISQWHPSQSPLLRAIGIYVRFRMQFAESSSELRAYQLYDDIEKGDYLLDSKVLLFSIHGIDGGDKVYLQDNGDIIVVYEDRQSQNEGTIVEIKKIRISGDFVLSVSATKHARAIYYDKHENKWYFFDNEVDKSKSISKSLQTYDNLEENLTEKYMFVRVFGKFQEQHLTTISRKFFPR